MPVLFVVFEDRRKNFLFRTVFMFFQVNFKIIELIFSEVYFSTGFVRF